VFGLVKSQLRKAGTPLAVDDVWFAARGIKAGSVLIAQDIHFKKVSGLRLRDII
jgi:predicted nucleic acid-binding protein